MFCPNCGSNETGKFCTKCGTPLPNLEKETVAHSTVAQPTQPAQPEYQQQVNNNQNGGQGKQVSRQYFSFLTDSLKQPLKFSNSVNSTNFVNGLITLILAAVFQALFAYGVAKQLTELFMRGFGGIGHFGDELKVEFFDVFIEEFFVAALILGIYVVVIFAAIKLVNKSEANFQDVLARFGSYMVVPAIGFLVMFLAVILGLGLKFIIILFLLTYGAVNLAFVLTTVSFKSNTKVDRYWTIFIILATIVIGYFIYYNSTIEEFFRGFEERLFNLF